MELPINIKDLSNEDMTYLKATDEMLYNFINSMIGKMEKRELPPSNQSTSNNMKMHVGRCRNCQVRPRTVLYLSCKHISYCRTCVTNKFVSRCTCMNPINHNICILPDINNNQVFCQCRGCIPVLTCVNGCTNKAEYIVYYGDDNIAHRCFKHRIDSDFPSYAIENIPRLCCE